jgi:hypothetical protein
VLLYSLSFSVFVVFVIARFRLHPTPAISNPLYGSRPLILRISGSTRAPATPKRRAMYRAENPPRKQKLRRISGHGRRVTVSRLFLTGCVGRPDR